MDKKCNEWDVRRRLGDSDLLRASKRFTREDPRTSHRLLWTTVALLVMALACAAGLRNGLLRSIFALLAGLLIVRTFIFYHDYMHGSLLRHSRVAGAVLRFYGLLVLTPPRIWRSTHNHHHAHNAALPGLAIGAFPLVSRAAFARMTKAQRLQYRVERHPLTVLGGYATVFAYKQCIQPLFEDPRRYWDSALALLLHVALVTVLLSVGGPELLAFTLLLPLGLATALGTYLFYAQHTCPGIVASEPESWSFVDAALRASSFMEGGALFHWFTGNIGYHHVHHLNPRIPFYRLPEAMRALPDLQIPPRTSIRPSAVWACLRLGLWDETSGRMMSFGASRARD